ncbi:MAG: hypothetical protein CVT88_03900 [Candidatus Altiarchaeales archaeon HGW-Altiarchaeales-1]|nr:MAG: hypothetical protein CVT88_03900 [Candidatus Altiarchaeales archaeon HGW-Altiarchaeales-1]
MEVENLAGNFILFTPSLFFILFFYYSIKHKFFISSSHKDTETQRQYYTLWLCVNIFLFFKR